MAASAQSSKRVRRSEGFKVRRWLQLGMASAGMSAALWGLSSVGPTVAHAAAEDSTGTAASSTSDDSGSPADSAAKDDDRPTQADDDATDDDATADDDDAGADEDATDDGAIDDDAQDEDAQDEAEAEAGEGVAVDGTDDAASSEADPAEPDTAEPDTSESDISESDAESPEPAENTTPDALLTRPNEPAVAPTAAVDVDTADPDASASPTAAVVAGDPWANEVDSPSDPRREAIAAQIDAFVESTGALIAALPIDDPAKEFLNEVLVLVRRTLLNQAPVVTRMQYSGSASGPIAGRVAAVDPEGDDIVYRLVRGPETGIVVINADGTYTYTPGDDFDGVAEFEIAAHDLGLHVNLLDLFRPWAGQADVLVNQGAIRFDFNYGEGAQFWTEERRAALNASAAYMARYFLVRVPVTLQYDVTGFDDFDTDLLAQAYSENASYEDGFFPTAVQYKILTGEDANGDEADGGIDWNFAYNWALGDTVGADQFDFRTVMMHELMHSLGFSSRLRPPGENPGQSWTTFASLIVTSDGRPVFGSDFSWDTGFDANLVGGDGGLYLGGAAAVAAYGRYVPLYTPDPWSSGSSGSHLDDDTFSGVYKLLMTAHVNAGPGVRVLSPIELGILEDMGYSVVLYPVAV